MTRLQKGNKQLSPSSIIWYQRKLGSKQAYRVVHQPVSRGLAVFADAWLLGWLAISTDLRENGSALEVVLHDYALYKSTFTLLYFTLLWRQLAEDESADRLQTGSSRLLLPQRPGSVVPWRCAIQIHDFTFYFTFSDPIRPKRWAIFCWKLALTCTSDPIRPTRRSPDPNRPTRWAFFWKLALTCTSDPIRPTRRGPDPNRPTRWAIFLKTGSNLYSWRCAIQMSCPSVNWSKTFKFVCS